MDSIIVVSNHSMNVLKAARFEGVDENTGQNVVLENKVNVTAVNYPVKTFENIPNLELSLIHI